MTPDQMKKIQLSSAAKACDDLADKLVDQSGKVYDLQDEVRAAWKGPGGESLDAALVDKGSDLTSGAGVLRAVARELRDAAAKVKS